MLNKPRRGKRPQGIDYIGTIRTALEKLKGELSLANELLQNADDAYADEIVFDFSDDALRVSNSKLFTQCSDVNAPVCQKVVFGVEQVTCDFHSFANILSRTKEEVGGKTGKFGIGFTAVYQITDSPEFSSGSMRWSVDPTAEYDSRIEYEEIEPTSTTIFVFPWIKKDTVLRQSLDCEPITDGWIRNFRKSLLENISTSMIFLKWVRKVEIRNNGKQICSWRADTSDGNYLLREKISQNEICWRKLSSDTIASHSETEKTYGRDSNVTVAVPLNAPLKHGKLFAYLPLQREVTGFPFHINADFFPSDERKHLLFEDDNKGSWNKAAIDTAATIFSNGLSEIRKLTSPSSFWRVLDQTYSVHRTLPEIDSAGSVEEQLKKFWPRAKERILTTKSVWTSKREWNLPSESRLLPTLHETETTGGLVSALEDLSLRIVHPNLSKYRRTLKAVGVEDLRTFDIIEAINSSGLRAGTLAKDSPAWLRNRNKRHALFDFLRRDSKKDEIRNLLRTLPIAINREGFLCSPEKLFHFKEARIEKLFLGLGFASQLGATGEHDLIGDLTDKFKISDAIKLISRLDSHEITAFAEREPRDYLVLIEWLIEEAIKSGEASTKENLRRLAIWPTVNGPFDSLDNLAISGAFTDPIGLAQLVDLNRLKVDAETLIRIGATTLTFPDYIVCHVKPHCDAHPDIPDGIKSRIFELVKKHIREWEGLDYVKADVAQLPIVLCSDGTYSSPNTVYFDSPETRSVLGEHFRYVTPDREKSFLSFIGVADKPKIEDMSKRLREEILPATSIDKSRIESVVAIIRHIGNRWGELKDRLNEFDWLKTIASLPQVNNMRSWQRPADLHSPEKKSLFESVGRFVYLGSEKSDRGVFTFLEYLGVKKDPSVSEVVKHLRNSVLKSLEVDATVYDFLQKNINDPITNSLKNEPFIWDGTDCSYRRADHCFWDTVPFGKYRKKLRVSDRKFEELFNRLGVKDHPDSLDAIRVLQDISDEFSPDNNTLDESARSVVHHCWVLLRDSHNECTGFRSVLNSLGYLDFPKNIFFDDFPNIAQALGISANVIDVRPDTYFSLRSAGVRLLSEAVKVRIISAEEALPAPEMMKKLLWKNCYERILHKFNLDVDYELLVSIRLFHTASLIVRYELAEMGLRSDDVPADSAFEKGSSRLYFMRGELTSLSSQLARLFTSGADFSQIAPAIKEVLSSSSEDQAHKSLDTFGFPKVDTITVDIVQSSELRRLDSEKYDSDHLNTSVEGEVNQIDDPGDQEMLLQRNPNQNYQADDIGGFEDGFADLKTPSENEQQEESRIGDRIGQRSHLRESDREFASQLHSHPQTVANSSGSTQNSIDLERPQYANHSRTRKPGKLRSYVIKDPSNDPTKEDPRKTMHRQQVDRRGIEAVLEWEKDHNRFPELMAPNFKGYDIRSKDADGSIIRYIEVKSISGPWTIEGVGMSKSQFDKARQQHGRFWLYVVEHTNSEPRIFQIQNPANLVDEYRFDDGWKSVAES